jgi:hypothetical protein
VAGLAICDCWRLIQLSYLLQEFLKFLPWQLHHFAAPSPPTFTSTFHSTFTTYLRQHFSQHLHHLPSPEPSIITSTAPSPLTFASTFHSTFTTYLRQHFSQHLHHLPSPAPSTITFTAPSPPFTATRSFHAKPLIYCLDHDPMQLPASTSTPGNGDSDHGSEWELLERHVGFPGLKIESEVSLPLGRRKHCTDFSLGLDCWRSIYG